MSKSRVFANPFYVALVVIGVSFGLTALAYCVMSTIALHRPEAALEANQGTTSWIVMIDRHGFSLMKLELVALAITTVAAIATDHWWTTRGNSTDQVERIPIKSDQ